MIWIAFGLLTAVTVAALIYPLMRGRAVLADRAAFDLTVYKDQLTELEREIEQGTLTQDQAGPARLEIQRRILALAGQSGSAQVFQRKWGAAILVLAVVPALGFGLYGLLGKPWLPDQPYAERAAQIRAMQDQAGQIRAMVGQLQARLEKNPSDGKGWAMLGRSLRVMGQMDQALAAYGRAVGLLPGDPQVRLELAALLLDQMPEGAPLSDGFIRLMAEINQLDPGNVDALYFLGVAAQQNGDKAKARGYWTRLADALPPGSPERADIEKQLEELK